MFRILMVCTGNICRSPTAERLLRHQLARLLPDAATTFEVTSAGTGALVGEPIQPHAAALLTTAGVDTAGFAARMLEPEQVVHADLVLTMTRQHRSAAATLVPKALPRLFTIREFARLAAAAVADLDPAAATSSDLESWARSLVPAAAARRGLVRPDNPAEDDVGDPYGGPAAAYREPFQLLSDATEAVARALAAPHTATP